MNRKKKTVDLTRGRVKMSFDRKLKVVLASESQIKIQAVEKVLPTGCELVCLGIEKSYRPPQPLDEGGRACAELRLKDILNLLVQGKGKDLSDVDAVIVMENYLEGVTNGDRVWDRGYVMIYWMQEGLSYIELTSRVEIPDYNLLKEMMLHPYPGCEVAPPELKGTEKTYGELLHAKDITIPSNNWTGTIAREFDRGKLLSEALWKCFEGLRIDQAFLSMVRSKFRYYQDFPETGVNFMDWHDLFLDTSFLKILIGHLARKYRMSGAGGFVETDRIDYVLGLESRGYMLAVPLALELGCSFVPLRKPGKLPEPLVRREYEKEYGSDVLELRADLPPGRVVIVDDVLATGGSLRAAAELARDAGHTVVDCVVVRDVQALRDQAQTHLSGVPVRVLIKDE